jgi:hypothetical protein
MAIDFSQPLPGGQPPDWDLPEIIDIQTRRVPFDPPKLRNFNSSLAGNKEVMEFLVRTNKPIPIRGLGPALFVGDVQVIECQMVENNLYRFLTFDLKRIKPGAPISLGWINSSEEERRPYRPR